MKLKFDHTFSTAQDFTSLYPTYLVLWLTETRKAIGENKASWKG